MPIKKLLVAASLVAMSSAGAFADGSDNKAFVYQAGQISTVKINQLGYSGEFGAFGNAFKAGDNASWNNRLDVVQEGHGNRIATSTAASEQSSQTGLDNRIFIEQESTEIGHAIGAITQSNTLNFLYVRQRGDDHRIGSIAQTGVGDEGVFANLEILQSGHLNEIGDVSQGGEFNKLRILQDANFSYIGSVNQYGTNNFLRISQFGSSASVGNVEQGGDDNYMLLSQINDGGTSRITDAVQTGTNGKLYIVQHEGTHGNTAAAFQSGLNNKLQIQQFGNDNNAWASQEGEGNEMTIIQGGNGDYFDYFLAGL